MKSVYKFKDMHLRVASLTLIMISYDLKDLLADLLCPLCGIAHLS